MWEVHAHKGASIARLHHFPARTPAPTHLSMQSWPCPIPSCNKVCRSPGGLTQHLNSKHRHHEDFGKRETATHRVTHPFLDGW